jgi:hypothetical protein
MLDGERDPNAGRSREKEEKRRVKEPIKSFAEQICQKTQWRVASQDIQKRSSFVINGGYENHVS